MTLYKILLLMGFLAIYIFILTTIIALTKAAKRGDQILGIENYYKEVGD